jgi:hypothetical protein
VRGASATLVEARAFRVDEGGNETEEWVVDHCKRGSKSGTALPPGRPAGKGDSGPAGWEHAALEPRERGRGRDVTAR